MTDYKPKLIEVALPLAEINAQASREKSIFHGHPSTLHLWWSRKPLAATRAVIWASLIDDPSCDEALTEEEQDRERFRLFQILEQLVVWENSNSPSVLKAAKDEIDRCFPDGPPPILDPFAGGGAIPLEAQRLGLDALGGDLNPVAVLIQKAMLEVPPRFAGQEPVHPEPEPRTSWERSHGLAADVDAYGKWMLDAAHRRIGELYPPVIDDQGDSLTPIAYIWCRTVESPDPVWHGRVPLTPSWVLRNKPKEPLLWVKPTIDRRSSKIGYSLCEDGSPPAGTMTRSGGICVATRSAISRDYIQNAGRDDSLGLDLLAIYTKAGPIKQYFAGSAQQETLAVNCSTPRELPVGLMSANGRHMGPPQYGFDEWWKMFTPRQLVALSTFSDLLEEVFNMAKRDAVRRGLENDLVPLADGGSGATAYAEAIVTYLSFALNKCADYWSTGAGWQEKAQQMGHTFGLQAVPMTWRFAEANPFSGATGSFKKILRGVVAAVRSLPASGQAEILQGNARDRLRLSSGCVISTDPPYYDSVPYADISDFFFVWLRRNVSHIWPDELATMLTPKADELVADAYRHGSKEGARQHFEQGMRDLLLDLRRAQHANVPATIYYAYKATEDSDLTAWATFLQGVVDAALQVTATWPLRTERRNRSRGHGSNALASSVLLVCRPRPNGAEAISRGDFIVALREELPSAVRTLQMGNVAPVDLAQSTIGPGMKVFSRYAKVVEADGSKMLVSVALRLINDALGEIRDGVEAELDKDTRFAIAWYEEHCFEPGQAGDADSLARAKDTSLRGLADSGIGVSRRGKFWLIARNDLDPSWDPSADMRLTAWEALQQLVRALQRSESQAAELLHRLGEVAEAVWHLAFVMFQKASDLGSVDEANFYNDLISAWPRLREKRSESDEQGILI